MSIHDNYLRVLDRIGQAARSVNREPGEVHLVVVTKSHPVEAIREVIQTGGRSFGENYVEEAIPKILSTSDYPDIEWHMIGHIQSRKANQVSDYFHLVHSLDSLKLAIRLDRFAREHHRVLQVLLECNISGEETKFGWPAWREADWPALLPDLERLLSLKNLRVSGLMAMEPYSLYPEDVRPCLTRLRQLRDYLRHQFPQSDWQELSMGMSADFEIAIQEGATFVRIGTAILGERQL